MYYCEQATAKASMQIIFTDSVNFYAGAMQKSTSEVDTYLKLNELIVLHHKLKNQAIAQV